MSFTGSNWGRKVLLEGIAPSASLSGFVALVDLSNIPVEAIDTGSNSALNSGGDLRFSTDAAGVNQLALEVVSYTTNATASSRRCQLWIRFPTYASGNRSVYMFYNKAGETQPAPSATYGSEKVWVDYDAVYHCESANPVDSSGNSNDLSVGTATLASGAIGDEVSSNPVQTSGAPSISISAGATVQVITNRTNSNNRFINELSVTSRFALLYWGGVYQWWNGSFSGGSSVAAGSSAFMHVTTNSSTTDYYLNGSLENSASSSLTELSGVSKITLNGTEDGFLSADAINDEFRISTLYISSDKVSSEHANYLTPSTFWTTGTPTSPGSSGISLTVTETGPSFTDAININLLALEIESNLLEVGPIFTESSSVTVIVGANDVNITEIGPLFADSVLVNIIKDVNVYVTEIGPLFTDSINVFVPVNIVINPRNIVRVRRKENTIIIKRKSNLIRVR